MPQYNPVDMTFSNSIKFLIGESSSASPEGSAESARPAIEQSSSQSRSKPQPSRNTSRTNASDGRPRPPQRIPSVQTRYMDMLLSQDTIPRLHNILASFFQWILLAGYLVLPATFNSISESNEVQTSSQGGNIAAKAALTVVKNVPLLYVGAFGAGVGLTGKACLYFVHRRNYIWLVNKIFMPGFMNSAAGLISTVVNIYSDQGGSMSVTAKVTLCATGGLTGIFLILFVLFNFWALKRVKSRHDRQLQLDIERGVGDEERHEGPIEMVKRLAHEPAVEPSSII